MLGAFYMQVVTPWLCACRLNGMGAAFTTDRSAAFLRRVGHAMVNWWVRQGSPPAQKRNFNNTLNPGMLSSFPARTPRRLTFWSLSFSLTLCRCHFDLVCQRICL